MSRLKNSAGSNFQMQQLEARQLLSGTVTPSFVPVTISAGALAADPTLANYQTFDLKVTITGTNDWASGDLYITLKSGSFYVPSGHNTVAQQSSWAGQPNLQFDSFVSGPSFASPVVLGRYKTGPGAALINSNTFDVAWGDLASTGNGTYTIARFTVTNGATGVIEGRVGNIDSPQTPLLFFSGIPRSDGGSIAGYVWNDVNVNGGKDPSESNYTGKAQVYLDANNNGQLDTGEVSARSRTNGNYTFTNVAAGTYRVRINSPSGYRKSAPLPTFSWNVTIIGGGAAEGKRFGITQKTKITGTVFNDGNNNGVQDSGELGREGFTVYFDTDNDGVLDSGKSSVGSDSSGAFVFDNLNPGTYIVRILDKKGFKRTTQASFTVALTNGQTRTNLLFGEKKVS